jgi:HlyD family secretion protein
MSDLPARSDSKLLPASYGRHLRGRASFARGLCSLLLRGGCALAVGCLLSGCSRSDPDRLQGYLEGEFVYVASPFAGTLEQLPVQRGAQVKSGDLLFALENAPEQAMRDEAERHLMQARANLEDVKKGKRPSEIDAIRARLEQAQVALDLSGKEVSRQEQLWNTGGATTAQALDRARSLRDQDRQRLAELAAELETAGLGARSDQVAAAEAGVRAGEAVLRKAEWDVSQKRQYAAQAGAVFDTLYRAGEWVAAGRPAVVLLPPQNIKLRMFAPETRLGSLHIGDPVQVFADGVGAGVTGQVSFISPQAEYTPPMIYSRESRKKFMYLVEADFAPAVAAQLHPGQPVEVQLPRAGAP